MSFTEYTDRAELAEAMAARLADDLRKALDTKDKALMAVPGGTTPGPIFDVLAEIDLDWSRVGIMLTDERWVPESSDRSNTRLLRERMFVGKAAKAQMVPLYLDAPEPEDKLEALSHALDGLLPIDVLVLGMGADMHTASIFPEADRLAEALAEDAPLLMPMRAPGAPEPRITLTAPVLNRSEVKHLVITGDEKRQAFEQAKLLPPTDAPVSAVLNGINAHWAP